MSQRLAAITLLVRDYDEAIAWFTRALGFALLEDTTMGADKRWVRVAPQGSGMVAFLLARAVGEEQQAAVGRQAGGRVAFFLHTDDFARDHATMTAGGVRFLEEPRHEAYGTVVVFEDLYGNRWDFIEPRVDPSCREIRIP
jgi:catechol 2,3-dioxygenase-like lactoylglutathione lyase family enzyme